jgi:hypothetical protein
MIFLFDVLMMIVLTLEYIRCRRAMDESKKLDLITSQPPGYSRQLQYHELTNPYYRKFNCRTGNRL